MDANARVFPDNALPRLLSLDGHGQLRDLWCEAGVPDATVDTHLEAHGVGNTLRTYFAWTWRVDYVLGIDQVTTDRETVRFERLAARGASVLKQPPGEEWSDHWGLEGELVLDVRPAQNGLTSPLGAGDLPAELYSSVARRLNMRP